MFKGLDHIFYTNNEDKNPSIVKFFNTVSTKIYYYTGLLVLVGNTLDLYIYVHNNYDQRLVIGNCLNIFTALVGLILVYLKILNKKIGFAIIGYSTLVNIVFNGIVFLANDDPNLVHSFFRDTLFLVCIIPLAGFIINKYHAIFTGLVICIYTIVYSFVSANQYLENNIMVIVLVTLNFTFIIFLLIQSLEKSIKNSYQSQIELEHQKEEIASTKEMVEQKNKQLISSISYAKRLQNAILPTKEDIGCYFKDFFILYKPLEIISGDIFFIRRIEKTLIIAVIDCTGHGVPGAMVSMVSYQCLNRALGEFQLTGPADILEKLDELVQNDLNTGYGENVQDGMDLSLISVNMLTMEMQYAGAFNPLYVIRNEQLLEFKGDRHPIGYYGDEALHEFKNHRIQLRSNDRVYLFSDGYADQFGGPENKKFSSKRFKELLIKNSSLSMSEQNLLLDKEYMRWRQDEDQIDDITILGLHFDKSMFKIQELDSDTLANLYKE